MAQGYFSREGDFCPLSSDEWALVTQGDGTGFDTWKRRPLPGGPLRVKWWFVFRFWLWGWDGLAWGYNTWMAKIKVGSLLVGDWLILLDVISGNTTVNMRWNRKTISWFLTSGISPNSKIILCSNGDGVLLKISGACYLLSLWKIISFKSMGVELIISEETEGRVCRRGLKLRCKNGKNEFIKTMQ